ETAAAMHTANAPSTSLVTNFMKPPEEKTVNVPPAVPRSAPPPTRRRVCGASVTTDLANVHAPRHWNRVARTPFRVPASLVALWVSRKRRQDELRIDIVGPVAGCPM